MIALKMKQEIILLGIREGKSKREISRLTGMHRNTVNKYINEYEECLEKIQGDIHSEIEKTDLINELVKAPAYRGGERPKRKLNDTIIEIVKRDLDENEVKVLAGKHKQVKKAVDIYEDLISSGFDISYSTIRQLVHELSDKRKEAFTGIWRDALCGIN